MAIIKFIFLLAFINKSSEAPIPRNLKYYGFIFDAGSTSTRLNIYEILNVNKQASNSKTYNEYPIKFVKKIKCEIVFDEQANADNAKVEIENCVNKGLKLINAVAENSKIWTRFVGTGGLRTLRNLNEKKFTELTDVVEKTLKIQKPLNPSNVELVQVIDAEEEAELGYISSIYNEGTETITERGVIDIGGSSFQVAFPITPNSIVPSVLKKKSIRLFNKDYNYGVLHFKCGGINNIRNYYLIQLFKNLDDVSKNPNEPVKITSPCHPNDFSQILDTINFKNHCTEELLGDIVLPKKFLIVGSRDDEMCQEKILDAFCFDSDAKHEDKCIIDDGSNKKISVSENIHLKLMGAWVYLSKELGLSNYASLVTKIPEVKNDNSSCYYGEVERCFSGSYLMYITDYFIKPTDHGEIMKKGSGWALGKMLIDSQSLFSKGLTNAIKFTIVIVSVLFLFLGLILLWYFSTKLRKSKSSKLQL